MSEYWDRLTAITEENKKKDSLKKEAEKFAESVIYDIEHAKPAIDD